MNPQTINRNIILTKENKPFLHRQLLVICHCSDQEALSSGICSVASSAFVHDNHRKAEFQQGLHQLEIDFVLEFHSKSNKESRFPKMKTFYDLKYKAN